MAFCNAKDGLSECERPSFVFVPVFGWHAGWVIVFYQWLCLSWTVIAGRAAGAAGCYLFFSTVFIHSAMSLRTSGAMVSSICPYSMARPVVHVWNRWLRPG